MVRYDQETARKGQQYIEDRRGQRRRPTKGAAVGGAGGLGIVGILIIVAIQLLGGADGGSIDLSGTGLDPSEASGGQTDSTLAGGADPDAETTELMQALMADIQDLWAAELPRYGYEYDYTRMVWFTDSVSTGCGNATSAVGPFYCPAPNDHKVYIDLGFYDELATRFGAPGDFAQAYVVAHEVGHHLQSVLGISEQVQAAKRADPSLANELSVRQELQADCYAGVWAYMTNAEPGGITLEAGDIEEGLRAAAAVGDDRIQEQAGMSVEPESWTHGSAEARQDWFTIGFETGDAAQCDTFAQSVSRTDIGL